VPIYEFICQSCGNEFEQIQSFTDSSVPACTKCQSVEVVRRMGRPAIHFKGSGWYITDSKKSSDKKESVKSADNGSESKKESSTESKTESTSDSAVETKSASDKKSESSPAPSSTPTAAPAD
jgi:putative FmdB family regulatory protein